MTIEQAKVYAKLSRKDLEIISCGYGKHYDAICAYAKGATIECRIDEDDEWEEAIPSFAAQFEYRVKPSKAQAEQPTEPWSPKEGEFFFFLWSNGEVATRFCDTIRLSNLERKRIDFGNCFRTREEAEAARDRVRAALKRTQK